MKPCVDARKYNTIDGVCHAIWVGFEPRSTSRSHQMRSHTTTIIIYLVQRASLMPFNCVCVCLCSNKIKQHFRSQSQDSRTHTRWTYFAWKIRICLCFSPFSPCSASILDFIRMGFIVWPSFVYDSTVHIVRIEWRMAAGICLSRPSTMCVQ